MSSSLESESSGYISGRDFPQYVEKRVRYAGKVINHQGQSMETEDFNGNRVILNFDGIASITSSHVMVVGIVKPDSTLLVFRDECHYFTPCDDVTFELLKKVYSIQSNTVFEGVFKGPGPSFKPPASDITGDNGSNYNQIGYNF